MKKELLTYKERKAIFVAIATKKFDTPTIRKQAGKKFDLANAKRNTKISSREMNN